MTVAAPRRARMARAIAELLDQLSRPVASRAFAQGGNPAQWAALRYLARANESARDVGAFAKFHLTTPSSASQTMSALQRNGLISKHKGEDARQRRLALTAKGRRLLEEDPLGALAEAVATLNDDQLTQLADTLQLLAQAVATVKDPA